MFMADFLLPGPLAPLAGLACCSAAVGAAYAFRKKIPHPAECEIIGSCCLMCKCHTHKKFDLVISVHEGENLPKGGCKAYLYVECGRFDTQTQEFRVDEKTQVGDIHERLKIHVRQMDEEVKFTMYKKLALSSEEIGSVELNVVKDLIGEDFPSNKWYTMKKDGKNTCKVQISFTKLEGTGDDMSPLLMQAMIQAQLEATGKGEPAPVIDFVQMDPKERLVLLSKALEGPLKMMKGMGLKSWTPCYVKLVESTPNEWEWLYWADKKACYDGQKRAGKLRMMGISNVLPDPGNRHAFYVKYHDSHGAHDYMFLRVERDRDIWSDGLYEFLDRLRDYLDKYRQPQTKAEQYLAEKKRKKHHQKASAAAAAAAGPVRRPSFLPAVRRVGVNVAGKATQPRPPKSLAAMEAEMYETDDDSDDDDDDFQLDDDDGDAPGDGGTGSSEFVDKRKTE